MWCSHGGTVRRTVRESVHTMCPGYVWESVRSDFVSETRTFERTKLGHLSCEHFSGLIKNRPTGCPSDGQYHRLNNRCLGFVYDGHWADKSTDTSMDTRISRTVRRTVPPCEHLRRKPRAVVCAAGCISHTWPSNSRAISTPQCSVVVTQLHTCYYSFYLPQRDRILSRDCPLRGLNPDLLNARVNMRLTV
jgi:hypothetical protein